MEGQTPYPYQVAVLTVLSILLTVYAGYLVFQWRDMTDKRWLKAIIVWIPAFYAIALGYVAFRYFGYDHALILLGLQYLYIITRMLTIYLFHLATKAMQQVIKAEEVAGAANLPSAELAALADKVDRRCAKFQKLFLKRVEI